MDFLYPSSGEEDLVILQLLVVSRNKQQLYGCCYCWNPQDEIAKYRSVTWLLDQQSNIDSEIDPSRPGCTSVLLAPIRRPASFLFSSGRKLRLCDNSLIDHESVHIKSIESMFVPRTTWTRTAQPQNLSCECDELFLIGEDRTRLLSVKISRQGNVVVERERSLPFPVKSSLTSLASVSADTSSGDILAVSGSSGEALVFVPVNPKTDAGFVVQSFTKRLPVTDSVIIDSSRRVFSPPTHRVYDSGNRLFTCSPEEGLRGSVTEHRHGYPVQIQWVIEHGGAFPSSVSNIWALLSKDGKTIHIVGSDTSSTVVLHVPSHCIESSYYASEDQFGFDLNARTLGANVTSQGVFIQLTKSGMNFVLPDENNEVHCYSHANPKNTINALVSGHHVLHVIHEGTVTRSIQLQKVMVVDDKPACVPTAAILPVEWEPLSFLTAEIDGKTFFFFGTFCGHLYIYTVDQRSHQLRFLSEAQISPKDIKADNRTPTSCVSLALLTSNRLDRQRTICCGLASGYVVPFDIATKGNDSVAFGRYITHLLVF